MNAPVRTCVGCSAPGSQRRLLRFTAVGGILVLDGPRRGSGRGAYLHPDAGCWTAFARRRGAVRSLRTTPTPAARERLIATLIAADSAAAR